MLSTLATSRPRRSNSHRFLLEPLENRRVMAAFVVSNLDDGLVTAAGDLPGSLRWLTTSSFSGMPTSSHRPTNRLWHS